MKLIPSNSFYTQFKRTTYMLPQASGVVLPSSTRVLPVFSARKSLSVILRDIKMNSGQTAAIDVGKYVRMCETFTYTSSTTLLRYVPRAEIWPT